jgi:hypothetical protein
MIAFDSEYEKGFESWTSLENQENCSSRLIVSLDLIFVGCAQNGIIEVYKRNTLEFLYQLGFPEYLSDIHIGEDWNIVNMNNAREYLLIIPVENDDRS